ncbi:protein phosphatase 1 regulatory subunit 35 [Lampris incognitus]|uniref:protein phosphatase 1 regulatory subunit 35 n=1 Tax=Lampris incognitus TaxID=2546036 RepID=UPI0024B5F403|nr:protein phosphatase 1 regulatory subunit 35 [Lampris incognitus]
MLHVDLPSPLPSPQPFPLSAPSFSPQCPDLDLSLPLSPTPKSNPTPPDPELHPPRRQGHRQVHFAKPLVVKVTPDPSSRNPHLPKQPTRSQRGRGCCPGRIHGQKAEPTVAVANEKKDCLNGGAAFLDEAELNTSLALKAELTSLQRAEFNSQKAVKETLLKSVRTKNLIDTKATEGVNVSLAQQLYSSLVSVNLEADQLISQALQDRLQLAPPTCSHDDKVVAISDRKEQSSGSSSLFEFFTPEFFREKPCLWREEPNNKPRPQPTPRPAHSTFDLFRRQIHWQATP